MFIHRLFSAFAALLASAVLFAQTNTRPVKGFVQDEDGRILKNVVIKAETGEEFSPNTDGSFEILVPFTCRSLTFSALHYFESRQEVDGSYLLVRLKYDKNAEEKERKEAEAKAKAEEEARAKAEKEAAKAEKEAAKAEKEAAKAAERAEKERLAAEEKARKDAETAAKEEEEAKARAEQERLDAEKRAQMEAEEAARAEALAKERAERKAQIAALDKAYNERFANKGFEHELSISYSYNLRTADFTYTYSGNRHYGTLHPFEVDYSLNYKFGRAFSMGVGAGVLYHAKSVTIIGDEIIGGFADADFQEKRLDIAVLANMKIRPLRTAVRPVLQLSGGYYLLTGSWMGEAAVGAEFRLARRGAIGLSALVKSLPYPDDRYWGGYFYALSIGTKTTFSF
jgi:hypothetical protein